MCSPEPKVGSFVDKTVKLRNRKPATSRKGCHHVLEQEPINGPTTPEEDQVKTGA
ncbi:unnamed protein product [Brassica oleracea var. botrytis]